MKSFFNYFFLFLKFLLKFVYIYIFYNSTITLKFSLMPRDFILCLSFLFISLLFKYNLFIFLSRQNIIAILSNNLEVDSRVPISI